MTRFRVWWLAIPAALGAVAAYGHTLHFGLWWDDYHALRPWTRDELIHVWHGSWDPFGIWPTYFRPLSTSYYALGFSLFGVNAWPLHLASLVLIALVGALVGAWIWRESRSPALAAFAAALYTVHPAIAQAEGPWFFLQTHTLCSLVVISALLVWQRTRHDPSPRAWWPVGLLTIAGFLIQEDLIVLAPALVAAQAVRARTSRDVPPPSRALVLAMALLALGLFLIRYALLGALGGRDVPALSAMALNLMRAVGRVLFMFQRQNQPVNAAASAISSLLLIGGTLALWRRSAAANPSRAIFLTGAVLYALFALPLVLLSSPSRYHLLAMSGVLMLTGAGHAISTLVRPRLPMLGLGIVTLASFCLAARAAIAPFAPCAPERLWTDTDVMRWPAVADDVRRWLAAEPAACARGDARTIAESADVLRWDPQTAPGDNVVLVSQGGRAAAFTIVDRRQAPRSPLSLSLIVDGEVHHALIPLASMAIVEVPLFTTWESWLRQMHRVDVVAADPARGQWMVDVTDVRVRR